MSEMNEKIMSDDVNTTVTELETTQENEVIEPEVVEPKGNDLLKNVLIGAGITTAVGLGIKLYEKIRNKQAANNGQPQKRFKLQLPWAWEDVPQQANTPAPRSNDQNNDQNNK